MWASDRQACPAATPASLEPETLLAGPAKRGTVDVLNGGIDIDRT
jgi:hypothetical protein